MALKPGDRWAVPLCPVCHALQHSIGEPAFWVDTDIPLALADRLWRVSGDAKLGEQAVFKARQKLEQRRAGR